LVSWLQENLTDCKENADVLAVQLMENQELTTRLQQEKQSLDKEFEVKSLDCFIGIMRILTFRNKVYC